MLANMDTSQPNEGEILTLYTQETYHPSRNQSRKACITCVQIKCKCIPRGASLSCERCNRLGKACTPSASAKRRGPKRGAPSRSARLEEKLDGLVTLLRTHQVPETLGLGDSVEINYELDNAEVDYGMGSRPTHFIPTPSTDKDYPEGLSFEEANESLLRFREEMIILTPYVYIPPDMTPAQLRQRFPFLWLNIMGVASQVAKMRNHLSLQTRRIIIERVVAGGERTLDLRLGILTFINWVHLFPMDKHFASLASQLAVSLIWDMGLQLPLPEHSAKSNIDINAISWPQEPFRRDRTIEEKRVVLGAFVITSMLSQTMKSPDGFRWSPYLDEYLAEVSHHYTVPQDKILVRQVKMQLIVNQFRYPPWKFDNVDIPTAWVDNLQLKLDEIISKNDRTGLEIGNEFGFYHYTCLMIREWIKVKPCTPRNEPDLARYKVYKRCLDSIKAWLGNFYAMPLRTYASVPFSTHSQLCYVVRFLHHMTTTMDGDWSASAAQEALNPLQAVTRIIHIFEKTKAAALAQDPGNEEDQALDLGIKKFQGLKSTWYSELIPQEKDYSVVQETEISSISTHLLEAAGFHILPDMLNDVFWQ